jgi:hypothetical protein
MVEMPAQTADVVRATQIKPKHGLWIFAVKCNCVQSLAMDALRVRVTLGAMGMHVGSLKVFKLPKLQLFVC